MAYALVGIMTCLLLYALVDLARGTLTRRDRKNFDEVQAAVVRRDPDARKKIEALRVKVRRLHGEVSWQYAWLELVSADEFALNGSFEDSVKANKAAFEIEERLSEDHLRIRRDALESMAHGLSVLGRFAEAHQALDTAEAELRSGAESESASVSVLEMRARVARREGEYEKSASLLQRLCSMLEEAPHLQSSGPFDLSENRLRLANALFALGEMEEGLRVEEQALRDADGARVYAAATRYMRAGNGPQALRLLKPLAEFRGELRVPAAQLVAYLSSHEAGALESCLRVLSESPEEGSEAEGLRRACAFLHFEDDQIDEGLALLGSEPSDLHFADALWRSGQHEEAQAKLFSLAEGSDSARRFHPWLMGWHLMRGDLEEAKRIQRKRPPPQDLSVGVLRACTIYDTRLLLTEGRFDEARARLKHEARRGQPAISRAMALHGRGVLDAECGHYASAALALREALAIYRRTMDSLNVERALVQLCEVLLMQGAAADESYASLSGLAHARNHTSRVFRLRVDARWAAKRGNHDEAIESAKAALAQALRCFGERGLEMPAGYMLLSEVLRRSGRANDALEASERAQRAALTLFGTNHPTTHSAQWVLGLALEELGNKERAREQFSSAKTGMERFGHEQVNDVATALVRLGSS